MKNSFAISDPQPLISCIMPTYGRPDYVPEAVFSFLAQDYPNKELILLNDCEGQVFEGDVPGVRVFNQDECFSSLGEKRNAAIELARGEMIAVWDDDDLSLPWRLSLSLKEMIRHNTPFYRPAEFLAYWGDLQLHNNQSVPSWCSHGTVSFTRHLWESVGKYPSANLGEDALFFKTIHHRLSEEFIKYPIARSDRFYILRGKSDYQHMSIHGGERSLDCTPGTYSIEPRTIVDPTLREAWNHAVDSHGIHSLEVNDTIQAKHTDTILSVCIAVKNRSRLVHNHRILDLFPRTVRSLSNVAEEIGPIELVIADYGSTDWPLDKWLRSGGKLLVKIVNVEGDFSRGEGLNIAARHACSDRLFLTDADVVVHSSAIERGLNSLSQGITRFPIFKHTNQHGQEDRWEDFTKGLAFVMRDRLVECGGVPEFRSWGGEDDLFFESMKAKYPVQRERDEGLIHQWHPESSRHENYVNPRKSDFNRYRLLGQKKDVTIELVETLQVQHQDWVGPVNEIRLYENGYMERPGLGGGSYELVPKEHLTLNWEDWPPESLLWDEDKQHYRHLSKKFIAWIA